MNAVNGDHPVGDFPAGHHDRCGCSSTSLGAVWKAELCHLVRTDDESERRDLLDTLLRERGPEVDRLVARVVRTTRTPSGLAEHVRSIVFETLLVQIRKWRTHPGRFDAQESVAYTLEMESRAACRSQREAGLLGGPIASGMTTVERRRRLVRRSRDLLVEMRSADAPTPSDQEVVAFHNERMTRSRKDPRKQAVLTTLDDLRIREEYVSTSPDDQGRTMLSATDARLMPIHTDSPDLDASERELLVCEVIRRAYGISRQAGQVADAFFADHLSGGAYPGAAELARRLGISSPTARAHLEQVRQIARSVFARWAQAS